MGSPPMEKASSTSSSHLGSNVIVRNTFIDVEESDGLSMASRTGRRVKTLPATRSPVAEDDDDDDQAEAAAASAPITSFARPQAVTWQASPTTVPQPVPQLFTSPASSS